MIVAIKGNAKARIDTINGRAYSVGVYVGEALSQSTSMVGEPNEHDVLAWLGNGWESTGILPETPSVPPTITAWQVRRWLIAEGITMAQVDAAIAASDDAEATRVNWEYAPYIERSHPMIDAIASALGLSAADVDAGFIAAEKL